MDSVHEELTSLRRSSTHLDQQTSVRKGLFDFARKSFSTNSSPIKQKVDSADNYSHNELNGFDEKENAEDGLFYPDCDDDEEFDAKSLEFDPFVENTGVEVPMANSTFLATNPKSTHKKIKYKTKSVRFQDWEKSLDENKLKVLKSKLKQFKKNKQPILKTINIKQFPNNNKERMSSSEYSATPDTTEVSEIQDHSSALSATQKKYLLPSEEDFNGKRSHLKRSELYKPLTDLTKTPKLNKLSPTEPVVSASTDESSVFSKNETLTEPSAKNSDYTIEDSQEVTVTPKPKAWRKFHASQKPTSTVNDSQNDTLIGDETTTHSIGQKFKSMSIEDSGPNSQLRHASSDKPFSLRLHKVAKLDSKKPHSEGSNEESYDQVDILEQSPPQLPDISYPNSTTNVFNKLEPAISNTPESYLETFEEFQLGSDETCIVKINSEVQTQMKQIIETLSHSSNSPIVIDDGQIKDVEQFTFKISEIKNLSDACHKRVDSLKIQLIKLNKQINDHETSIKEKDNSKALLQKKLNDVIDELEGLKIECTRCENKISNQSNSLAFERQTNEEHERTLLTLKKQLVHCQTDLENKELYIENLTRLTRAHYCEGELDLMDEKKTFDVLKELLLDLDELRDKAKNQGKVEKSLKREISKLSEEICELKDENIDLKDSLKISKDQSANYKALVEKRDSLLQDVKLENENYGNLLKSLECSYSDLKTQLENEKFRTKELEARIQELEIERLSQGSKTLEMDKVLKDQLSLINDAQKEIDNQNITNTKLSEENHKLKKTNLDLIKFEESYKSEINRLQNDLVESKLLIEKGTKLSEDSQRNFTRLVRSKDEEVTSLKKRINELQVVEGNLASELKDTRSKLSDKFSQCSILEKKNGSISKSLKDSNENNRILRSEILKNNGLRQELKRTLVGLSIGIIKELDGIIDNDSLSTVRQDLKNESDNRELEKLHDVSLFIEEAVGLIIKEYWALNKRLSESQIGSLSNNSLGALQQIIEGQNDRLKQLQAKLHYYEGIFKKINKANSRSQSVRTRPSTSAAKDTDTRRVRVQVSRDSEDSIGTVRTMRTSVLREKKENEINRLLSKVKDATESESTSD